MRKISLIAFMAMYIAFTTACAQRSTTSTQQTQVPSGPVVAQSSQPGEIPAGTELVIRTNDSIEAKAGETTQRTYSAEVAREVESSNGTTLIPKGSPVTLAILNSQEAGTTGTQSLELAIQSVTIGGNTYNVQSGTVEQRGKEGLGGNERTGKMVGGGAILGTLIGAVAGGAKGAVVGAVAGAGAGAAAQVMTRGNEVRVPAESVLTFRNDNPIYLQGFRQ
jgi:hypothetical protein